MIINWLLFATLGLVASGSQETSNSASNPTPTPLQAFEAKLADIKSGDRVYKFVDECEELPDHLNEMASDPGHMIPITDPYLLYRFHQAVHKQDIWKRYYLDDVHYKIGYAKGKIAEIEKAINDLEHPAETNKGIMHMFGTIFNGKAETKRQLDARATEKASAETDLRNLEAKQAKLQDEVDKITKFMRHFNVEQELDRLEEIESVKKKIVEKKAKEEAEDQRDRERRREKNAKKAKHIKWGGIHNF